MSTRRDFVRALALCCIAPLPVVAQSSTRSAIVLRVGLLHGGAGATELQRGFAMGIAEAQRAASLVGSVVSFVRSMEFEALAGSGCTVVVSGVSVPNPLLAAAAHATSRHVVLLNAACGTDSLRAPACGDYLFHVVPSDAMRRPDPRTRLAAWDPRLYRFGAEQLNDRYRHRFRTAMTDDAWCGWMAAKIAWEAAVRARASAGPEMRAQLLRASMSFDGHKGRALRFNAADRQLYQPLYAPGDLREVRTAPPVVAHGASPCGR